MNAYQSSNSINELVVVVCSPSGALAARGVENIYTAKEANDNSKALKKATAIQGPGGKPTRLIE